MKHLRKIALIAVIIGALLLVFGIALAAMSMYNTLYGVGTMGLVVEVEASEAWRVFFDRLTDKYAPLPIMGLVLIALSVVGFIVSRKKK